MASDPASNPPERFERLIGQQAIHPFQKSVLPGPRAEPSDGAAKLQAQGIRR